MSVAGSRGSRRLRSVATHFDAHMLTPAPTRGRSIGCGSLGSSSFRMVTELQ